MSQRDKRISPSPADDAGASSVLPFPTDAATLQAFIILLLANVLFSTWEELFFVTGPSALPHVTFETNFVFFSAKSILMLGLALFAMRRPGFSLTGAIPSIGSGVLLVVSTIGAMALILGNAAGPAWFGATTICGGVGMAIMTLAWFQAGSRLPAPQLLFCYLLASIASPLPMAICYRLNELELGAVGLAFIVLSVVGIVWTNRLLPSSAKTVGTDVKQTLPSLLRVLLLLAIFGFVFGLREPLLGSEAFESGSNSAFGSLLIAVIVLFGAAFKGSRFDLAFVFRIVLPLTAVAFLLLPLDFTPTKEVSDFCASMAFSLTTILIVVIFAMGGEDRSLSPIWFFGITFGLSTFCASLGKLSCWFLVLDASASSGITSYFDVISAGAIALTILLIPDKTTLTSWVSSHENDSEQAEESPESASQNDALPPGIDPFTVRCHEFAKHYGLTPREEEVLALLIQRKTGQEIEQTLYVSKETVKSHRKNIYAKCNVHSRDELEASLTSHSATLESDGSSEGTGDSLA